jgi:hypothetical protein
MIGGEGDISLRKSKVNYVEFESVLLNLDRPGGSARGLDQSGQYKRPVQEKNRPDPVTRPNPGETRNIYTNSPVLGNLGKQKES